MRRCNKQAPATRGGAAPSPSLLSLPEDLLSQVLGLDNPRNCIAAAQINHRLRQLGLEAAVQRAADPDTLCAATSVNSDAAVQALLAAGADPTACGRGDALPLHHAAEQGNVPMVRLLLEAMAAIANNNLPTILNTKIAPTRATPLMLAVQQGHNDVAHMLLDKGADIDMRDGDGPTLLCAAVKAGHEATCRLLLSRGTAANRDCVTAALAVAAENNNVQAAKLLLSAGAQVDGRCAGYHEAPPPLHVAAARGHLEVVRLLIRKGADKEITSNYDTTLEETPLNAAARNGHLEAVELLLAEGANVNGINDDNATALHIAASRGDVAVMQLLLSHSALVNVVTASTNATPLVLAAARGHLEAVEVLLLYGALLNAQAFAMHLSGTGDPRSEAGWTALHLAARYDYASMARALLAAGADKGVRSESGETALDVAERGGSTEVASLLLSWERN